jgi:hypothetical protein
MLAILSGSQIVKAQSGLPDATEFNKYAVKCNHELGFSENHTLVGLEYEKCSKALAEAPSDVQDYVAELVKLYKQVFGKLGAMK